MSDHALLSPSAAHRWLNCTPAPRLEATLPDNTSEYAEEGTLAHCVCEATAKKKFKKIKAAECTKTIKRLKKKELWDDEMLHTAEIYVDHLYERAMRFEHEPYIAFEVKVDISEYVPDSFGRCDCVMFGGDTLVITDYKHGKGVPVNVEKNPQLMLYGLGALKLYRPLFGDAIKKVELYVDQPRIDSYNGWTCSADELVAWGESIKPTVQKAFMGLGEYKAGSWCQFCRANGQCKAQADQQISAFDDFKDQGTVSLPDEPLAAALPTPALLTPEALGQVLTKGQTLVEWYEAAKKVALDLILDGKAVPGWKAVEGRSTRIWSDQDKALEKLQAAGIDRAVIYDSVPKTLAQLEKMLGKTKFKELVGDMVVRPQGKPALADESDTRKVFNSAEADFAGVATKEE